MSNTTPVPDGRAYESPVPAFSSVADFRACSQLIRARRDVRGNTIPREEVPCAVERIGGYRSSGELSELTDILFGDGDQNRFVFPLAAGDYDVLRIVDCPTQRNCAEQVYFTMIALPNVEPISWRRFPHLYGSDAYNMTVISPECRRRITEIIEHNSAHWNLMCDMIGGYREHSYREFEALGFRLGSPEGFGDAVFTPTSKVAYFFLGYTSGQELVAIQGRWL